MARLWRLNMCMILGYLVFLAVACVIMFIVTGEW
jgi:hypothetical protein